MDSSSSKISIEANRDSLQPQPTPVNKIEKIAKAIFIVIGVCLIFTTGYFTSYFQNNQQKNSLNQQVHVSPSEPTASPEPIIITTPPPTNLKQDSTQKKLQWITYQIPNTSLSFSYPEEAFILNSDYLSADSYSVFYSGTDTVLLQILMYNSNKNVKDWWNTEGTTIFRDSVNEMKRNLPQIPKDITFNFKTNDSFFLNFPAMNITIESNYNFHSLSNGDKITAFKYQDKIVLLLNKDNGNQKINLETKKILDSFKTNSTTTLQPKKTYTNRQNNFSFNYPDYLIESDDFGIAYPWTGSPQKLISLRDSREEPKANGAPFNGYIVKLISIPENSFNTYIGNEIKAAKESPRGILDHYPYSIGFKFSNSEFSANWLLYEQDLRVYFIPISPSHVLTFSTSTNSMEFLSDMIETIRSLKTIN